jgi:hypothetical protein
MQRYRLIVGLLSLMLLLLACRGAKPTLATPAGAVSGLNTFIYIYSDT